MPRPKGKGSKKRAGEVRRAEAVICGDRPKPKKKAEPRVRRVRLKGV
jgi:hypothetical protein